jgi:4-hydroxybenzoate polyprenyltransferase
MTSAPRSLLDALVFSNLWMATAAGALVAAASRAMGTAIRPEAVGLAFAGTLVVYNVDRLRDLHRDQHASRDRSAFIAEHEGRLSALTGVAAAASLYFGARAGWLAALVLLPVLGVGLLHRRLKRFENAKIVYIAASWTCVGFGLPAVLAPDAQSLHWVASILTAAMLANVIAFNVREEGAHVERVRRWRALQVARVCAGIGVALGALAPSPPGALVAIPLMTLLALVGYQPTERFSPLFVDGALLVGSLIAVALA